MKINKLASKIAYAEGKKHQASIGDIREILKILRDILNLDKDMAMIWLEYLYPIYKAPAKKKPKKRKKKNV